MQNIINIRENKQAKTGDAYFKRCDRFFYLIWISPPQKCVDLASNRDRFSTIGTQQEDDMMEMKIRR